MDTLVAIFGGVIGAAMAGIWARDILSGHGYDAPNGLLRAREADSDDLMIWHWAAEFGTAFVLIAGAFLILINPALAEPLIPVGLAASSAPRGSSSSSCARLQVAAPGS